MPIESNIEADHLLLHFTPNQWAGDGGLPLITRGEGCWVYDADSKRYFDGLSSLFCSQLGHSVRPSIVQAVIDQLERLPYWTNWTSLHPSAAALATRLGQLAPPGLDRVFFVNSGSEANESAIKLARQYHAARGEPLRYKTISRRLAYHGTTLGALSLTGIPALRSMFEPLMAGARHVSNTNRYHRAPGETESEFVAALLAELEAVIEAEDPRTVSAVFLEPVQNAGGCFTPPDGYFEGVRAICDRHGILLVCDEVICAFGRLGHWFACERYGISPDVITFAKGVTSAVLPLGGLIASSDVIETMLNGDAGMFAHGSTWGGHPVACAAALAVLDTIEHERVLDNVATNEAYLRSALERLKRYPIVGDVRGAGYFFALEIVRDADSRTPLSALERDAILFDLLSPRLMEQGLICRTDDRGDPVIQLSPPLIATRDDIDWVVDVLDRCIAEAARALASRGPSGAALSPGGGSL